MKGTAWGSSGVIQGCLAWSGWYLLYRACQMKGSKWYGTIGKGQKSPCDAMDLGEERCFRFSVLYRGGEGGTSRSDAELSAARPVSGFEWAEANARVLGRHRRGVPQYHGLHLHPRPSQELLWMIPQE